uniref:Uncharacterized protein n=1 Tax=Anguilla anguilla TaxID=7936 RepID=A0A0E9RRT8_ANGAN
MDTVLFYTTKRKLAQANFLNRT